MVMTASDDATDGATDSEGQLVSLSDAATHAASVRMLSAGVRTRSKAWVIPAEQPLELLFFRNIYNELLKRERTEAGLEEAEVCPDADSRVSFEAFQISLERLFFILGDKDGFDGRKYVHDVEGGVVWADFFRVYKQKNVIVRNNLYERIYVTLDNPESSHMAQIISNVILATIIISSVSFVLSTLPSCHVNPGNCTAMKHVEFCCLLLFIIEYVLRVTTCWAVRSELFDKALLLELVTSFDAIKLESPLRRLVRFVLLPSNLIDVAAILPGIISRISSSEGGAFVILRLVRLTRILRAFKSPALAEAVKVITKTMQQSTQALYILAFNLMLGIVIFGSLMYMAEGGPELNAFGIGGTWNPDTQVYDRIVGRNWDSELQDWIYDKQKSPFQSIPHACWWAMVTASTVGYGDMFPTTPVGKLVGVATMLFSLVILALPVGVIGGTFGTVWDECDLEKKIQDQQTRCDLEFVTTETSRLDPSVLSKMLLIEVWNDQAGYPSSDLTRPSPALFMGEAKVEMELQPHLTYSKQVTLPLEENSEIAKRTITGKITFKYEWTPDSCVSDSDVEVGGSSGSKGREDVQPVKSTGSQTGLRGTLVVTVISAERLVNLECGSSKLGSSCPYCMVMCYPQYSLDRQMPKPSVWRAPTAQKTVNPNWDAAFAFRFRWEGARSISKGIPQLPDREEVGIPPAPRLDDLDAEAKMDMVLKAVTSLSSELQQHKVDVDHIRQGVRNLTAHVDAISRDTQLPSSHPASSADMDLCPPIRQNVENRLCDDSLASDSDASVLLPHCVPNDDDLTPPTWSSRTFK